MTSKFAFKPEKNNWKLMVPLFVSWMLCAFYSSVPIHSSSAFADKIFCCCLTIFISNLYYIILTTSQFLYQNTLSVMNSSLTTKPTSRNAIFDDRRTLNNSQNVSTITSRYTIWNIIFKTMDFSHESREVRLFVSREEVWSVLYPNALGIFLLFFCVPLYDMSCSLVMGMGFLFCSLYQEYIKGKLWKRPMKRTACHLLFSITGFICIILLFFILQSIDVQESNYKRSMYEQNLTSNTTEKADKYTDEYTQLNTYAYDDKFDNIYDNQNSIGTLLHNDDEETQFANVDNITIQSTHTARVITPYSKLNNSSISDMEYEIKSVYESAMNDVNSKNWLPLWMLCFCIPMFFTTIPESTRIPVVLEMVQPSLGFFAGLLLLLGIILKYDFSAMLLLANTTSFFIYSFVTVPFLWMCVYFIVKSHRDKTMTYISFFVIVLTYTRILMSINSKYDIHTGTVTSILFTAVIIAVHAFTGLYFWRQENTAIRSGWNNCTDDEDDDEIEFLSDLEDGVNDNDKSMEVLYQYTIDDVLHRVTNDISETEKILVCSKKNREIITSNKVSVITSDKIEDTSKLSKVQEEIAKNDEEEMEKTDTQSHL